MDRSTTVYRIFPLKRFLQCLKKSELALVDPIRCWDDTYEDIFTVAKFRSISGLPFKVDNKDRKKIFGICWSQVEESDAIWRIYSNHLSSLDEIGIRVETTVGKLQDELASKVEGELFISKVKYLENDEFVTNVTSEFKSFGDLFSSSAQEKMFRWKRFEFKHEDEVRVFFLGDPGRYSGDFVLLKVNPSTLFDCKLLVDPRVEEYQLKEIAARISALSPAFEVTRSSLYTRPEVTLPFDFGKYYMYKDEVLKEFGISEEKLDELVQNKKVKPIESNSPDLVGPPYEYGEIYHALKQSNDS